MNQTQTQQLASERVRVAKEIASQIGSKALYMIGAKNLVATDKGIRFGIMRHPLYNYIEIELTGLDLYNMTFGKHHNGRIVRTAERNGLYDDMLTATIREVTGLATSL